MTRYGFIAATLAVVLTAGVATSLLAPFDPVAFAQGRQGTPADGPRRPHAGPGARGLLGSGGPGGARGIGFPGLRELDLTEAQREQVKTITQSHRAEVQQVAVRVHDAQRAIDAAAAAAPVDEAAIRARSTELATALADGAILRGRVNAEIVAILTSEQQQKLQELRGKMAERMKQRGERRPARPGR
jgi:protein CpxP